MAAAVNLIYNASRGTVSYAWRGSTLLVTAKANTYYGLTRISVACNEHNDSEETYDSVTYTVTHESFGHNQCTQITVTVDFVPDGQGTAILYVYAQTVGLGGSITPAEQEKVFLAGVTTSVRVTFTITPDRGYQLDRLVNESGTVVSESTSTTIAVNINVSGAQPGDEGHRTYFAYFTPRRYKYNLRVDYSVPDDDVPVESGGTNRKSAGMASHSVATDYGKRRELYYRSGRSYVLYDQQGNDVPRGDDHPFAYATSGPDTVTVNDVLSLSFGIVPTAEAAALWDLLDLEFKGWLIEAERGPMSQQIVASFPADSESSGNVEVHINQLEGIDYGGSAENIKFTVHVVVCSKSALHRVTFSCIPPSAGLLNLNNDNATVPGTSRAVGSVSGFAKTGGRVYLSVESFETMGGEGLVHGWSMSLPDHTEASFVAGKAINPMPNHDIEVKVYLCTHRLMHGATLELLHGSQRRLLYDCNVPPGTTVYD